MAVSLANAFILDIDIFNSKGKLDEVVKLLDKYIPAVAKMETELGKYRVGFSKMSKEHGALVRENDRLEQELADSQYKSVLKKMEDFQLRRDYDAAVALLERIPPEVLQAYAGRTETRKRNKDMER